MNLVTDKQETMESFVLAHEWLSGLGYPGRQDMTATAGRIWGPTKSWEDLTILKTQHMPPNVPQAPE